uniref:Uncharacterized protein n=1 Tax=Nelumbo nucifera TaxID=4432 RepID=A0A822YHY5_NELNU|nr:TPA_asm: hypothetical protein HUJ06_009932 [Nelumbo nucifera]
MYVEYHRLLLKDVAKILEFGYLFYSCNAISISPVVLSAILISVFF